MNRKQSRAKRARRQAHNSDQRRKLHYALNEARHQAAYIGANGKQLKTPRSGKAFEKAVREQMEERGYVPNGRGGWRPLNKVAVRDTITKS